MFAKPTLFMNRFDSRILEFVIESKLIEPVINQFCSFLCSNKVVLICDVPSRFGVVFCIIFDAFSHCITILRVVKHEHFWVLSITVVYQVRKLLGNIY